MKKMGILMLALLVLCLSSAAGLCDYEGMAVIYARNGGKVHLREEAASESASLGLFFTGTLVEMRSDPYGEWVKVRIDGASGYIRGAYLRSGEGKERIPDAFWQGVIVAKNYVNFRRGPSTEYNLVGRIDAGEAVEIMGETSEGWYHVRHGSDTGYVSCNLVRVTDRSAEYEYDYDGYDGVGFDDEYGDEYDDEYDDDDEYGGDRDDIRDLIVGRPTPKPTAVPRPTRTPRPTATPAASAFPHGMPMSWTHASGAGAWSTQLLLDSDGAFFGYYHDAEANNVVLESSFSGRISGVRRRDAYSYSMTISSLELDGTPDTAYAQDGVLYIVKEPAGLKQGDTFVLYLPGTPKSRLSQEELSWLQDDGGSTLDTFFLCSQSTGRGFVPGDGAEENG